VWRETGKEGKLPRCSGRVVQSGNDVVVVAKNVGCVVVVTLIGGHSVVSHGADFLAGVTPNAFDGGDHFFSGGAARCLRAFPISVRHRARDIGCSS
jgi:hypothetical protein